MAVGNAVLDVVLAPGFLEKVQRSALLFRQRLAEIRDRHPGVIAEVRGEGLLLGLVAACPNGELVEALRAEKLLAVAAGDNVVRLLPPLIIDEPEIAEADRPHRPRRDAASSARSASAPRPARRRHERRAAAFPRSDRHRAAASCAGSSRPAAP